MMNAGVMYEKAKQPEEAADVYLDARAEVPRQDAELAEKAAFTAGAGLRDGRLLRPRRRRPTSSSSSKFRNAARKAADALFNAGVLRQALGQHEARRSRTTRSYAKQLPRAQGRARRRVQHRRRLRGGRRRRPRRTRRSPTTSRTYRSAAARVIEAHDARRAACRSSSASSSAPKDELRRRAQKLWKRASGEEKADGKPWAAEARYHEGELIFREYEKVTLDVKPRAAREGAQAEEQAARRGREGLPRRRRLPGPQVGDRGAVPHRPGLRGVRRVAASTRRRRRACRRGASRGVPRRARQRTSSTSRRRRSSCSRPATQKAIQMQVYDEYTAKIREALGRARRRQVPAGEASRAAGAHRRSPARIPTW